MHMDFIGQRGVFKASYSPVKMSGFNVFDIPAWVKISDANHLSAVFV
jgi:hypothetical protein